jgi:disulfide bond formation protein DsbB
MGYTCNCRQHEFPICILCLTDRFCYSVAGGICGLKAACLRIETNELFKTKTNFELKISGLQQA